MVVIFTSENMCVHAYIRVQHNMGEASNDVLPHVRFKNLEIIHVADSLDIFNFMSGAE